MRVYSEQEVSQILERAVERQATAAPAAGAGLSLTDLERLGAEVGIDPAPLRAAAAEVARAERAYNERYGIVASDCSVATLPACAARPLGGR